MAYEYRLENVSRKDSEAVAKRMQQQEIEEEKAWREEDKGSENASDAADAAVDKLGPQS
jgi:hypothetical protein